MPTLTPQPARKIAGKRTSARRVLKKAIAPPAEKLVYTRDEVAAILCVHPMTILRMTNKGTLRQCRGLRRSRYSHEELQRYLRDNTRGEVTTKFKA